MPNRRSLALGPILVVALVSAVPGAALAAEPAQSVGPLVSSPATTSAVVTKVTPYYDGRTLTWSAFDQLGIGGIPDGNEAAIYGVSGGSMGIVETGTDHLTNEAASWVSADGGATWREQLVMSETRFGPVVGHGGVLVTTGSGFYSSTDGAIWTEAPTGPHELDRVLLAAGPRGFVAFAQNGRSSTPRVWLSSTGRSWTAAPLQSSVSGFCATSIAATSARIVAVGYDCKSPTHARVLVSSTGVTWTSVAVPSGLRVGGAYTRNPSVSYVASRFLVTGSNATQTGTWVWSSTDGRTWRHISSMPRVAGWSVDTIVGIFALGPGYIAIGHRDMPADDAVLVAWRSSDLVHWSRFSPPVGPCDATVHEASQAAVVRGQLVAVGSPWSIGGQCGETWMAGVTP